MVVDFKLTQGLKGGQNILEELLVKEILPKKSHVIYIHVLQVITLSALIMETWLHTWAEDLEAYRKNFDYQSGNPDQEQTNNLRLAISRSRPKKFLGLAWEIWYLIIDYQISQARVRKFLSLNQEICSLRLSVCYQPENVLV